MTIGMRRFPPLAPDHPAIGSLCGICDKPIRQGDETTLIPTKDPPTPEDRVISVEASLCHWPCIVASVHAAEPERSAEAGKNRFDTIREEIEKINEGLHREQSRSVIDTPEFRELFGECAELAAAAARIELLVADIEHDAPEVWKAWLRVSRAV